jgi:cell division protein FtsZ
MPEALKKADEVLQQAVQGITDLINVPSLINLDFADVQTVMRDKGIAHIGIGVGKGDDKAIEAVKQAVDSPLLETTISGATDVIVNISGDITLVDSSEAVDYVRDLTGDDANIIFGAKYDDTAQDVTRITVIATGLESGSRSYLGSKSMAGLGFAGSKPLSETSRRVAPAGSVEPKPVVFAQPKKPVSSVEEKSIQIPTFLQKNRKDD